MTERSRLMQRLSAVRIAITESPPVATEIPIGIGAADRAPFHTHSVRLCDELHHALLAHAASQRVKPETVAAEAIRAWLGLDR